MSGSDIDCNAVGRNPKSRAPTPHSDQSTQIGIAKIPLMSQEKMVEAITTLIAFIAFTRHCATHNVVFSHQMSRLLII